LRLLVSKQPTALSQPLPLNIRTDSPAKCPASSECARVSRILTSRMGPSSAESNRAGSNIVMSDLSEEINMEKKLVVSDETAWMSRNDPVTRNYSLTA